MFRLDPALPPQDYRSFTISAPRPTHWRPATCAEVGCLHHHHGWQTTVDEATTLGQMQAYHVRRESGLGYTEHRDELGMTVFTFAAGQTCFSAAEHKVRLDRQEHYLVTGGDWRGNPRGERRVHASPGNWVEDFQANQDRLVTLHNRG